MRRSYHILILLGFLISGCSGVYPKAIVVNPEPVYAAPTVIPSTLMPELSPTPEENSFVDLDPGQTITEIDMMLSDLIGLPLREFYDQSFLMWISRDPEAVTVLGLDEKLGMRNNQLTDISEAYILETERLERGILRLLNSYDRETLDEEGKLTFDIYKWFFEDRVEGQQFRHLTYPVHNYPYSSVQNQFIQLMVLYQPLENKEDIEDYIARLEKIDKKMDQLIRGLTLRQELGGMPPRIVLVDALNQTNEILSIQGSGGSRAEDILLYKDFSEKLDSITSVPDVEKIEYSREVLRLLDEKFIPAYKRLSDTLTILLSEANDDAGVWKLKNGEAYYQYLIHHFTSQDLTAEQVFTLGGMYVREDRQALVKFLLANGLINEETELEGFSQHLFETYEDYAHFTMQENNPYLEDFLEFYDQSKYIIHSNFQTIPTTAVLNITNPNPSMIGLSDFYAVKDPLFDLSPELFRLTVDYTDLALRSDYYANYIPGLAYQRSFMDRPDWPLFRQYLRFSGYAEGWSNYVLSLMTELRAYGSDPLETVYKLEHDLFLSSSVVIDSGIHQQGWSLGEGSIYLEDQIGLSRTVGNDSIERYTVMPGQVLAYRLGEEKFQQLRYTVEDELGPKFSMADYHEWLLSLGDMPLEILEDQVGFYIQQQLAIDTSEPIP